MRIRVWVYDQSGMSSLALETKSRVLADRKMAKLFEESSTRQVTIDYVFSGNRFLNED